MTDVVRGSEDRPVSAGPRLVSPWKRDVRDWVLGWMPSEDLHVIPDGIAEFDSRTYRWNALQARCQEQ